jgi:xylulokinase
MKTALFVIGFDLGTSGCKAVLVDGQGSIAGEARESYPTQSPHPGWAEQDPADWKRAATAAIRRLLQETGVPAASVAGIGLTSAAHIGVLADERGDPLRPAILWNDQRTVDEVADLEREAGDEILRLSLQAVSPGWTLPHLRWVRRHDPEAWSRLRALRLSKDWLLQWLTGEAVTDPATALSAQLTEARAGAWSPRLCGLAGLSPDRLPRIAEATATAGFLTAEAARDLGLTRQTAVVNGTLDSATELLAAGLAEPGDGLVRLATAGGVERVVGEPGPNRGRITYPHPVTPLWYCQAGTSTCAAAVQWGMKLFGNPSYETWDSEAAETPPGAEGLLFHPYLAGERAPLWDPRVRGSFIGLSLRHGRGHLARALYEGASFSIRHAMCVLDDIPASGNPLAVVGGGARSALWTSVLADVLGRELRIVDGADSALGAALLGLAGLGLSANWLSLVKTRAAAGRLIRPDPERQSFYDQRFTAYVDAQSRLSPFYAG